RGKNNDNFDYFYAKQSQFPNRRQKTEDRRQQNQGKIYAQTTFERANQLFLQLSRILYKTALFFAKQTQFSGKSNGCKLNYNKGL
ncbi:MAG: hypothetical protein ACETVZ_02545, partial [Phycisphaerae bacterium]